MKPQQPTPPLSAEEEQWLKSLSAQQILSLYQQAERPLPERLEFLNVIKKNLDETQLIAEMEVVTSKIRGREHLTRDEYCGALLLVQQFLTAKLPVRLIPIVEVLRSLDVSLRELDRGYVDPLLSPHCVGHRRKEHSRVIEFKAFCLVTSDFLVNTRVAKTKAGADSIVAVLLNDFAEWLSADVGMSFTKAGKATKAPRLSPLNNRLASWRSERKKQRKCDRGGESDLELEYRRQQMRLLNYLRERPPQPGDLLRSLGRYVSITLDNRSGFRVKTPLLP